MDQNSTLKDKTKKGIFWNFIEKFSVYGIQFVITVIIARILDPSDFGLIGMLAIFTALSNIFIDSGFTTAIIQKKDRTETDFSTVFYTNFSISVVIYFILFIFAPVISRFYDTPVLTSLTRVIFLNIIIQSLTLVQYAKLSIEMDFKSKAIINSSAVLVSGFLGIVLAYKGFGVWALVVQTISKSMISLILLLILKRWRPLFKFSMESFERMFRFSFKLLIGRTISTIAENLYTLVIGKTFSATELGYYTKANQFSNLMSGTVSEVLQNVTFPVMSLIQDEDQRLYYVYRKLVRFTMFGVLPVMIGFVLISEPFVRLLLTEKWLPAVPLLQWLCIGRVFSPVGYLNLNILNAKGRSEFYLKVNLIKAPLTIITLLLTFKFGVLIVVIGQTIVNYICFFINAYFPGKLIGYGAIKQLKDMSPMIISVFGMSLVVLLVNHFIHDDILKIFLGTFTGAVSYYLFSKLLRIEEVNEAGVILTDLRRKIRKL